MRSWVLVQYKQFSFTRLATVEHLLYARGGLGAGDSQSRAECRPPHAATSWGSDNKQGNQQICQVQGVTRLW